MLDADWGATPVTRRLRQRAAAQLGSSGSGNHVAELGTLTPEAPALGLAVGAYVALLSHSGSPGTGAQVADHATRLAAAEHPEPPKVYKDIETVMAAQISQRVGRPIKLQWLREEGI